MGAYRKAGRQPNILVIMVDQQRLDMLETYGHQVVRTPNLNRLAEEGARFDNATTVCAQCLPARTSLLTGQAPHYHGAIHNNLRCQREMPFLSKKLAEQFHHSVYIGKWHVPEDPYQVGFTTYISEGLGEGEPYRQYLESRGVSFTQKDYQELYNSIDLWTNERCETPFPFDFEDHWDVFKFRQTEQFLLSVPEDEPFFACVSFLGPHPPWSIPEEYHYMYTPEQVQLPPNFYDDFHKKPKAIFTQWGYRSGYALSEAAWKEGTAVYWGYITMIDDLIGRLLDILDDRGLTEDTIVVYFSDHGEMIGAHRLWGKHDVLYEEVMRIPLIIRYPALITANQKVSMPVSIVDIFPTLLELCGVAVSEQQIAGRSFVS
jgi:arylsulfatase A-like enzyme